MSPARSFFVSFFVFSVLQVRSQAPYIPQRNDFVRIKRGMYANDIAQIHQVEEQGMIVTVRLIPRLDLNALLDREKVSTNGWSLCVCTQSHPSSIWSCLRCRCGHSAVYLTCRPPYAVACGACRSSRTNLVVDWLFCRQQLDFSVEHLRL